MRTGPGCRTYSARIHSARADALARIDRAQQLGELDQAIGSFVEALNHMAKFAVGPLAVLIDAYVRKGVSMHERTFGLNMVRRTYIAFAVASLSRHRDIQGCPGEVAGDPRDAEVRRSTRRSTGLKAIWRIGNGF